MVKKKGFTLIELLVVVAIIALLISILLPSLSRARELTKRAVCSSNLRGIGNGCHIYSNDNSEWFPQSFYQEPQAYDGTNPQLHSVTFTSGPGEAGTGLTGKMYWQKTTTTGGGEPTCETVPISRSLFLLVIGGQCTPKLFVCPSSGENEDVMRNYNQTSSSGDDSVAAQAGVNRFDFRGYPNVSYAYQMPFGMHGKPRNGMDPRMPLAADKGPYFIADRENPDGRYTPEELRSQDPNKIVFQASTDEELLKLSPETWRAYNSRNHNGEGQNVLSADGHVEYDKVPTVGLNSDNIYTRTENWDGFAKSFLGVFPLNGEGPYMNTDSLLIP